MMIHGLYGAAIMNLSYMENGKHSVLFSEYYVEETTVNKKKKCMFIEDENK